jgi:hypothetical protein
MTKPRLPVDFEFDALPLYMELTPWCRLTGLSRSKTYDLATRGSIHLKKLDGRTLVDVRKSLSFLEGLPEVQLRRKSRWGKAMKESQPESVE